MLRQRVKFDVAHLVERRTSGSCFICEFLRGNSEYRHVAVCETESAIAFLSKYPPLLGYVIVAPKEHREQVTGDFTLSEYLALQRFIYEVAEGMRRVLLPERVYLLSLGSQAANAHVHWHLAPLPSGVPLEHQQYHALMHEFGIIEVSHEEQIALAAQFKHAIYDAA